MVWIGHALESKWINNVFPIAVVLVVASKLLVTQFHIVDKLSSSDIISHLERCLLQIAALPLEMVEGFPANFKRADNFKCFSYSKQNKEFL